MVRETRKTWQPAELSGLLGTFEVRLVHFVHNWKFKTRPTWLTMDAICIDLAKSVRDMGGDMSKCPWTVTDAPAASAQSASKESAIVEYAADGSMSQTSLKDVFGMELGTTVTLKKVPLPPAEAPVYHIAKIDGLTVTLVGTDEDSTHATITVGELVDLYKVITYVEDIVVRAADIPSIEEYPDAVAESIKSGVKAMLYDAFRLNQPKNRVDLKIKGNGAKLVFASHDYPTGHLKVVPYSKSMTVVVEGKAKNIL